MSDELLLIGRLRLVWQDKSRKVRRGWGEVSSSCFNQMRQGVRRLNNLSLRSSC